MEQAKQQLPKFVAAAQTIIYEPSRAEPLLKMMGTKDGAIDSVKAVISAIEQKTDVPAAIEILLGPIILMLLVELAKEAYGKSPNPKMLDAAIKQLMSETGERRMNETQETPEQAEPMPQEQMPQGPMQGQAEMPLKPQGIIQGAMQ